LPAYRAAMWLRIIQQGHRCGVNRYSASLICDRHQHRVYNQATRRHLARHRADVHQIVVRGQNNRRHAGSANYDPGQSTSLQAITFRPTSDYVHRLRTIHLSFSGIPDVSLHLMHIWPLLNVVRSVQWVLVQHTSRQDPGRVSENSVPYLCPLILPDDPSGQYYAGNTSCQAFYNSFLQDKH